MSIPEVCLKIQHFFNTLSTLVHKKLFFELQTSFYHRILKILWLVDEAISLDFKEFVLEPQFSINNPVALGDRFFQLSKSVDFM